MWTGFGWLTYASLVTLWSMASLTCLAIGQLLFGAMGIYSWGSPKDKNLTSCLKTEQKYKNSLTNYKVINEVTTRKRILR